MSVMPPSARTVGIDPMTRAVLTACGLDPMAVAQVLVGGTLRVSLPAGPIFDAGMGQPAHVVLENGLMRSVFWIAPGVHWNRCMMTLHGYALPATVLVGLAGKDLADVVGHDLVPRGMIVTSSDDTTIPDAILLYVDWSAQEAGAVG